MFESFYENLAAVTIMIDGVPYAPIVEVMENCIALITVIGLMCGFTVWLAEGVYRLLKLLLSIMINWIKARRVSKTEKQFMDDPRIAQFLASLDKVDIDDLIEWYNTRYISKSE